MTVRITLLLSALCYSAALAACEGGAGRAGDGADRASVRRPGSAADALPAYGARAVVRPDDCVIPRSRKALAVLKEPGLAQENELVEKHGLERVSDVAHLGELIKAAELVPIPETEAYAFDQTFAERDPDNAALYKHGRPYVKTFLDDVLGEGYRCFGTRFPLTSLTRTDDYQKSLTRVNPNAAKGTTDKNLTTHTTGGTVDIGGALLPLDVRNWLRHKLAKLEAEGRIQATEESGGRKRWSTCFHVMVFPDKWPVAADF